MDVAARSRALLSAPLFAGLPRVSRERVAARMTTRTFDAGDALLVQGEPGDCVLVLVEGTADVRLRRSTGSVPLATVGPGSVLGEMALITGSPRNADAVAVARGSALSLGAADFRELTAEMPELSDLLTEVVAGRLGRAAQDGLGDKVLEGYRVVRPVGRGGTAVVYEAERLADGARLALKMMSHLFAKDAAALLRFDREADLLTRFRHAGITRCHGRFHAYGTVFLVMDFVDGASLDEVVLRAGPLPAADARRVLGSIAAALAHVHRHGVVHGDLKPANVLVDLAGASRLTDFGIARAVVAGPNAREERVAGTPCYMAPEQFTGAPPSVASDLHAVGCILAETLTGRPPVEAPTLGALIRAKRDFDAAAYARGLAGVDDELRAVLASLLAREPGARVLDFDRWARDAGPLPPARVAAARAAADRHVEGRHVTTLGT